ncbi:Protein of unknown function [Gryllus bimaculatus]|nr:Protein of unknown function [Gryllus bimaculatus]
MGVRAVGVRRRVVGRRRASERAPLRAPTAHRAAARPTGTARQLLHSSVLRRTTLPPKSARAAQGGSHAPRALRSALPMRRGSVQAQMRIGGQKNSFRTSTLWYSNTIPSGSLWSVGGYGRGRSVRAAEAQPHRPQRQQQRAGDGAQLPSARPDARPVYKAKLANNQKKKLGVAVPVTCPVAEEPEVRLNCPRMLTRHTNLGLGTEKSLEKNWFYIQNN